MEVPVLPFKKQNYQLLALSALIVLLGFIVMSGGKSSSPEVFNPEVFSHWRISVAPTLVISGYLLGIFAILYRPKA